MLLGIINERGNCLEERNVFQKMNIFHMFYDKSLVHVYGAYI